MAQNSPPPSLQELNRRADLLAARAKLFLSGSTHRSSSLGQSRNDSTLIGHRPHPDLEGQCREIATKIKQLKSDCYEFPELPVVEDEESPLGLLLKERRLQAELEVWKKQRPSVFCRDPLIAEEDTVRKVRVWGDELQRTLKVVRDERKNLIKELEREEQLLDETRSINEALEKKRDSVEHERSNPQPANSHSVEERLERMEEYCSILRESLQAFVDEHLIQSSEDLPTSATSKRSRKRQRNRGQSREEGGVADAAEAESHPSLVDVIQRLISKCLDTPEDPYTTSETIIWPPHFQLLLRSWVIERHPDNPTLVRLTPFHTK